MAPKVCNSRSILPLCVCLVVLLLFLFYGTINDLELKVVVTTELTGTIYKYLRSLGGYSFIASIWDVNAGFG